MCRYIRTSLLSAAAIVAGACSMDSLFAEPEAPPTPVEAQNAALTTVDEGPTVGEGLGIAVNSFLWRAALETTAFLPLHSEDPFGGVIETDWYSPAAAPDERVLLRVYILSRELRSDGIRVDLRRQVRRPGGPWQEAHVDPETALALEAAILARAREMRVAMSRLR